MVKTGDILYALYGATSGEVSISKLKGAINQAILAIRPYQNYDSQFLMQWLRKSKETIIGTYLQGGQGNLSGNIVKELLVDVPTSEEQKQIGNYFSNLDSLITLHQRKCDGVKSLKKYMLQKMFPQNEQKVPEIRFEGFTEAWEQRKLGEITESYSGGTPTAGKKEYYDGNIPFIRSGEISSDKTELFISDEGLNNSSAKMVKTGDILYALYGATSGEVSISKLKGAINQAILAIRPYQNYDSQFLMQWLRKSKETIIGTYLQGGQGNLSGNIVKELLVDVPTSEEQKQIGNYFSNLDSLITLHQRKCDGVKSLKKYMLQKMFPQNEQKVPEIRFEGFTEAWEQRKLDDVVEFLDTMRKPLEGAKRASGPYPYYGASGIVDYVDGYLFDEELVLLSEDGANITDRNYPVCFLASGKYWVNNHAHVLRTKKENENNFICNSLERKDYTQYNTGMAMPKLNKETCRKIPVLCPAFEEQQKIGDYFRSLDHLITLHQRKPIPHPNHPTIHTKHKGEEKYVRIRVNDREKINRTANLRRFPVDIPEGFKDGGGSVGEFQIYSGAE